MNFLAIADHVLIFDSLVRDAAKIKATHFGHAVIAILGQSCFSKYVYLRLKICMLVPRHRFETDIYVWLIEMAVNLDGSNFRKVVGFKCVKPQPSAADLEATVTAFQADKLWWVERYRLAAIQG